LLGGGVYTITWTAADPHFGPTPIALAYSTDGGLTFQPIAEGLPNSSYLWNVPAVDNEQVRVRVTATDLVGHAASDASDENIILDSTPPTVTLTAPNGGEIIQGGSSYTITWTATDAHFGAHPIALAYSTDGGATFPNLIVAATENDGSYVWPVPLLDSFTVQVQVRATDLAGNNSADASDDNVIVDSTVPSGNISVAEGPYVRLTTVHLQLAAAADTVALFVDGDLQDGPTVRQWVAYTTTLPVTLTGDEGLKTIRVRFRDLVGNEGPETSTTVRYDITPPTLSTPTPVPASTATSSLVEIGGIISDSDSGILSSTIVLQVDERVIAPNYDPDTGIVTGTSPTLSNGLHTIRLAAEDQAGNVGLWEWQFTVNEPPSTLEITLYPTSLEANGVDTATVTATVRSASGYPVLDDTPVVFSTTLGMLNGNIIYSTTTRQGAALAIFYTTQQTGTAVITAQVGMLTAQTYVLVTPPVPRAKVYLPLVAREAQP
jgi:hypothetical protein